MANKRITTRDSSQMLKFVFLIFITLFICCSNCTAAKIVLQYATHTADGDDFDRLVTKPLFANISQATSGRVVMEPHFNETLLKYDEIWDGLAWGEAATGLVISSFYYDRTPLSNLMDLPTLPYTSAQEHAGAMWRMYEKYPEMQAEYQSQGLRPLLFITTGREYLFTSRPVAKLEDLRDVYLITDSPLAVKQFEFFDTADIHFYQLYEIFNITDHEAFGFIGPMENFAIWRLEHLTPYATRAPLSFTYITIAMSEKQWQKLPADIKKQLMNACGEAASRRYSAAYADYFNSLDGSSKPTFITMTPAERQRWLELNQPLVDEWLNDCKARGLGDVAQKIHADLQGVSAP